MAAISLQKLQIHPSLVTLNGTATRRWWKRSGNVMNRFFSQVSSNSPLNAILVLGKGSRNMQNVRITNVILQYFTPFHHISPSRRPLHMGFLFDFRITVYRSSMGTAERRQGWVHNNELAGHSRAFCFEGWESLNNSVPDAWVPGSGL